MFYDRIDAKEKDYLYLATSKLHHAGQGLFVSIPIYKNEIISIFKGERLSAHEASLRAQRGEDQYFIECLDGSILDSMHVHCFAKYANDPQASGKKIIPSTLKPNADIGMDEKDRICLIATRNIKTGEEIFCSYGKKYWKNFHKII